MYRIGTTSYIIPADILPNVTHLAPLVDDVELVLFETDEWGSNLPDAALCARLAEIAAQHSLTYTVHLPLDLWLSADGDAANVSLIKARRVIDATRALAPFAYTLHLDGRPLAAGMPMPEWQDRSQRALATVSGWLDDPRLLSVENLEAWDPAAFAPLIEQAGVSRTVDIGHLWLKGVDALPQVRAWIDRARVVHLHGIGERDHASLALASPAELDPLIEVLTAQFEGVLTLEVFNEADLNGSLAALRASEARVRAGKGAK